MIYVSYELTMPNRGSWDGKWTGDGKKYYHIERYKNKYYNENILPLIETPSATFHYDFGDGWGANIKIQVIDKQEAKNRQKITAGFAGYEWMIKSLIKYKNKIVYEQNIK